MINATEFHDLASGRQRGLKATLLRAALRAAECPYALAVRLRNRRYDRGAAAVIRVAAPVVSVGNLTVGGTGKTPLVARLAGWFHEQNVPVALVSRGYGTKQGEVNDEAIELEQRLPGVPHVQNPDRVAAARRAIDEFGSRLILLDDGFQHRRIHRDLDIVLLDATAPFGFDHLLPRGLLREPIAGLHRADIVALSRADMVEPTRREEIRRQVERIHPNVVWMELVHRPQTLIRAGGEQRPSTELSGEKVAAFCGIGNPAGFYHSLESCGCEIVQRREFPDHHPFAPADIEELASWADENPHATAIVCTHKDLVKIGVQRLGQTPLWALAIGVEMAVGQEELENRLQPLVDRARAAT